MVGSHKQYVKAADRTRRRAIVTVDVGKNQFDKWLMKSMIRQSLLTQEEFCSGVLDEVDAMPKPVTEGGKNA
jgi:hypothetical protein